MHRAALRFLAVDGVAASLPFSSPRAQPRRHRPFGLCWTSRSSTGTAGDMESFATGYKNSPDILFMGSKISRGYEQMVETYRKGYSTQREDGDTRLLRILRCSRSMNASQR